jgi:multiple sugar transport system ATP-binding protein
VAAFGDSRLALEESKALTPFVGKRVILGVRPEHIEDAAIAPDAPEDRRLAAVVDIREDLGSDIYVHFGVDGPPVLGEDVRAAVGDDAVETTEAQTRRKGNLWVARVGHTSRAREGEPIELVVDTSRLRFFDPETGDGIYANPADRTD